MVTNEATQKLVMDEESAMTTFSPLISTIEDTNENNRVSPRVESELPILQIIEDNPDIIYYIKKCLQDDYIIRSSKDGHVGIEDALEVVPDIIITDLMMPRKNGYEVVSTLKNDLRTSHIPILMLTAKADIEAKIEGLDAGADAYLTKPFNEEELKVRLKRLVSLRLKLQKVFSNYIPNSTTKQKVKSHEEKFLDKVNENILLKIDQPDLNVIMLCKLMNMSRSQLYRKISALTNKSIVAYIRFVRITHAKTLLSKGDRNVSDVAYEVGFSDLSYFSKVYQKEFGVSPSQVIKNS